MPGPLRGIARRLADRLRGPATVGDRFTPATADAFAKLDADAEGLFGAVGAAVVSSWEVLLTDVGRALHQRVPKAVAAERVQRLSDALVPTASPLQHGERPFQEALRAAVREAQRTGRLSDATLPLVAVVEGLGAPLASGWGKTVQYMAPVIDATAEPEKLRGALAFTGGELRGVFEREAAGLASRLELLPHAPALEPALLECFETWKHGVVRGLEIALYEARTRLLTAVNVTPADRP